MKISLWALSACLGVAQLACVGEDVGTTEREDLVYGHVAYDTGCPQSAADWTQTGAWPVPEIALGDGRYSRDQLLDLISADPDDPWSMLAVEYAAAQLNAAITDEIPVDLWDQMALAEVWFFSMDGLMAEEDPLPPTIAMKVAEALQAHNIALASTRACTDSDQGQQRLAGD